MSEPRVYRCTTCGFWARWGPGWLWYGDLDHDPIKVLCPKCAEPHQHEVITP